LSTARMHRLRFLFPYGRNISMIKARTLDEVMIAINKGRISVDDAPNGLAVLMGKNQGW